MTNKTKQKKDNSYQSGILASVDCINEPAVFASAVIAELCRDILFIDEAKQKAAGLDTPALVAAIRVQQEKLKHGDVVILENMLLSQAHALNGMFTYFSLGLKKAVVLTELQSYGELALKAQNQSRETISTLATIKQHANNAKAKT